LTPNQQRYTLTQPNQHLQRYQPSPPLHTPKEPTKADTNNKPSAKLPNPKSNYTHQSLKALTLNTRGMHTTILDLQKLLTNHLEPHIIALTETKHRHIKSVWRQTFRNYKLVYNPSLYNNHTKRCSGGTILAVHKSANTTMKPIQVPPPYHPYLAIALLHTQSWL